MKNILINIICREAVLEERLISLIDKCYNENYNVCVNLCDYTLEKNVKDINIINVDRENQFAVNVKELDFEDVSNHNSKLAELMDDKSYDIVLDIESSIELEDNFIDELELNFLEDDNYGCVYCDFYSKTKSGHKIHIHQKSLPLVNNSLPLIAFSVKNYLKHIGSQNVKGDILANMISRHVPKALCCITNA